MLILYIYSLRAEMIDISKQHSTIVKDILSQYVPLDKCLVFGSRANGTARASSDLDILIMNDSPLDFGVLGELLEAFAESDLPFRVDIVQWSRVSESFKECISPHLKKLA